MQLFSHFSPAAFCVIFGFNKGWKCVWLPLTSKTNYSHFSDAEGSYHQPLPLYPHCDTVTTPQPSSCTVAFAATSLCGTHPLNDLEWHRTDWLFSPHQATSVKQHSLNSGVFFPSRPGCFFPRRRPE